MQKLTLLARENDIEGAARGRPILAKSRLIDALLGKPGPRPKLEEIATRAAIKAWVIDTTETRAAHLAERARRAAEQAAAVEAAAATEAAAQEALAQAEAEAQADDDGEAMGNLAAEDCSVSQRSSHHKRPGNGDRDRSSEAIHRRQAVRSARRKAKQQG